MENSSVAALASFTLNDGPVFIDVINMHTSTDKTSSSSVLISAVTNKGHLHLFNHQLVNTDKVITNGSSSSKLKKPIKSLNQLQIETHEGTPLKIYAAFVTNQQSERLDQIESMSNVNVLTKLLEHQCLYII